MKEVLDKYTKLLHEAMDKAKMQAKEGREFDSGIYQGLLIANRLWQEALKENNEATR